MPTSVTGAPDPADAAFAVFREAIASRYVIEREIARGGMSRVYLAEDQRHRRRVALKVLPPDIADAISRQRFTREIETVAGLTHPNILPLYDSGEAAGRRFFAMPLVEGSTLRERLREQGRLQPSEAITIAEQISDALAYAHGRQVVHRDVKPENILFVAGHAVLADFGIARDGASTGESSLTTEDGGVVGTQAYMSPEQATAGRTVDGRSDIYSLGVVLHEMLTGGVPTVVPVGNAGEWRLSLLTGATGGGPAPPSYLMRVVERAVALDPVMRFENAAAFSAALRRPERRRRWPMAAAGVAVATGVALFVTLGVGRRSNATPAAPALTPRRVVVAQFANPGSRPDIDYLGVMAADWITEGLQRTGTVDVVPTPTALQAWRFARDQRNPVRMLAEETGAAIVITGSYYTSADGRLEVQVQVSDASTSKLLGAVGPIGGPGSNPSSILEAVQSRVMGLLSLSLDARIGSSPPSSNRPPTFEAYREFSEGLRDYVENDFTSAAVRFTRAWERDTSFATALLMASISRSNEARYATADSLLDLLVPLRERLDPAERYWFDYRRNLLDGRRADALTAVRRLAEIEPGTKATYNYAVEAMQNGSLTEARRVILALPGDRGPMRDWAPYWEVRSRIHHMLGQHDHERKDADSASTLFPNRRYALVSSVRVLATTGRVSDLLRLLEDARRMPADPYGIVAADLALEAGTELRAHGFARESQTVLTRGLAASIDGATSRTSDFQQRYKRAELLHALQRWRAAFDSSAVLAAEQPTNANYLGLAGISAARAGDRAAAESFAIRLAALPRRYGFGDASFNQARIAVLLGQEDRAATFLRQAMSEGYEFGLWAHRDPVLSNLQKDVRFASLLSQRTR